MESIFYGCSKLNYLDISLFTYNDNLVDISSEYNNLFFKFPSSVTIIINKSFYDKIKYQIPDEWNIIKKN
jgi:hypothetical protein